MDQTSMDIMKEAVEKYGMNTGTVIDIGSYDVNGTYRELFTEGKYIGVDIQSGPNVDMFIESNEWDKLKNVDAVISGQTLEHVTDIPRLMNSIYDVLKPQGLLCIIVPSAGPPHDYPTWVGNFSEERLSKIITESGFEILETTMSDVEPWHLLCCVAKKSKRTQINKIMRLSNFHLAVAIPLTFPMVPSSFFYSFAHMDKTPTYTLIHADNGPIDTLRNDLAEMAMGVGATHIIFMDTDMNYHPQTIPRLLFHRLPIVGALCYRRYPPFDPILLRGTPGDYESIDEWKPGELVEVDATGCGCLLFEMSVFRKMPRPWFKFRYLKSGEGLGEDIGFCSDLKNNGYKIFVDTTVPSGHLTTLNVTDSTYRLYKAMKTEEYKKNLERALDGGGS